jgi:tRNA(fMet)-specific endonuclease VapC
VRYLLDTNVCIRYLNGRSVAIRERLRTTRVADIAVCSVVKAEQSLARQQQFLNLFVSLPFDDAAALIYGHIRADLAVSGTPIGPNDLQIASIARANSLILVTHNTGEFSRVDGLQIEDWEEVP